MTTFDPTNIPNGLSFVFDRWTVLGPLLGLGVGLLLIYLGTGSFHLISVRLWQLVLGKREIKDGPIGKFLDDQDALMHLRLSTRIKRIECNAQAHRLIRWTECHQVSMDRVAACGSHFDIDQLALRDKLPGWRVRFGLLLLSALCFFAAVAAAVLLLVAPPLIKVVKSGAWYAVTEQQASRFEPGEKTPRLRSKDCSSPRAAAAATQYALDDVIVICDAMNSPEGHELLEGGKTSQTIGLTWAALVAAVYCMLFYRAQAQIEAAVALRKRLDVRQRAPQRA